MFFGMSFGIRMYQYNIRRRERRIARPPRARLRRDQSMVKEWWKRNR
jgi:hypothetical protein